MDITGFGALFDFGGKVIDKLFPDPDKANEAKLKLFELQQNGELAKLGFETQLIQGQLDVNKVEAANSNTFISGWRPFAGWTGGIGLAYAAILEPFARFVAQVGFNYTGTFPVLDTTITMQILFGLLGLGAYRTFEKKNGVAS